MLMSAKDIKSTLAENLPLDFTKHQPLIHPKAHSFAIKQSILKDGDSIVHFSTEMNIKN
jgi:hypothetical protein